MGKIKVLDTDIIIVKSIEFNGFNKLQGQI